MKHSRGTHFIVASILAVTNCAAAVACPLSTLTIEASKGNVQKARFISDVSKGDAAFFEGYPYTFVDAATVRHGSAGVYVDQNSTSSKVDIGFKWSFQCIGNRLYVDFSHVDLVGVKTLPMALMDTPSYPPIVSAFRATLLLDGRPGSKPELRTENGWSYLFRVE